MGSSYDALFDLIDEKWWTVPKAEIEALQVEAAAEYFQHRRAQVQMLDRRATDTGVEAVKSLHDIVPLLFSHTTYKSYPMAFVERGQWDRMTQWLRTLSARPVDDVNLAGVSSIDEWVAAMASAGHTLVVTSGTSGKCSFLDHSPDDLAKLVRGARAITGWPRPLEADNSRRFYAIGPSKGPQKGIMHWQIHASLFAKPDAIRFLTDEPISVAGIMRSGALRRSMMDGTASPDEVKAFETQALQRMATMNDAMNSIIDDVLEHRGEPMFLTGMWAQIYRIAEIGRQRGVPNGTFSPETYVASGGGRKTTDVPVDFIDQLFQFLGPVRHTPSYGMSELAVATMGCEAGRFHAPPWLVLLLLDEKGEVLVNPSDGVATGRAAFLDMSFEGRWGGIITGDKISVDFAPTCPCGRVGPVVLNSISRYIDASGDDKLGCAGTFDQYMRGMLGV